MQSRTIGNITYGPGVCGATLDCGVQNWEFTPINSGTCGVDYVCNATSPHGVCSTDNTGCYCYDKCIGGGLCSIHQKYKTAVIESATGAQRFEVACKNVTAAIVNATLASVVLTWSANQNKIRFRNVALTATPEGLLPCGGRCNSSTQACVQQQGMGYLYQLVPVDGVLTYVMNSEVCCPRGYRGNACEIPVGCSVGGCDNGGQCLLTSSTGTPLAARDTRCFGCPPGNNMTGPGWGGAFCHIRNEPTFVFRNATVVVSGRRLLATEEMYRASQARNTAASGAIFQEPSRACDCAVRWSAPVVVVDPTLGVLRMGNVSADSLTVGSDAPLLSRIRFGSVDGVLLAPYWHRRVRSVEEAKWLCSRDWGSGGFYLWTSTADATYVGSFACVADPALIGSFRAPATTTPSASPELFPSGAVQLYALSHIEDTGRCPDPTLDRVFYCDAYPTQCAAIIDAGGVGNHRIPAGLSALDVVRMAAVMHFSLFGHLVRNAPNAACDLTSPWAEDETGCANLLRAPKSFFPLPDNTTHLSPEICGNVTRIEPDRVAFGPLTPGATGTNVTDAGHEMCQCNPPFRATDPSVSTDCAYDLCGTVDGRGRVNATYVGVFNASAVEACVCTGVWGTDPRTCEANTCAWCGSTICQNLGTVNGLDYNATCQCLPIFTGDLCETSLCNATQTHPFNASLWDGQPPSTVICDCLPGFTGTFCDDLQCVHGLYSYVDRTCACRPGFHGAQCQHYICAEGHGIFVPSPDGITPDTCDCYAPWTGATCEQHTCDTDNVVLSIAGWAGVRPFGQPVPSTLDGPTLWECGCNFPYMPTSFSAEGRPLNCFESICGQHGTPNANASNVLVPADACTCSDPFNKGITTDPAQCTGFSYDLCRKPCGVASCGLSKTEIDAYGYVPIASDDASCCRCHASVGYFIQGECQPFCAATQPCITSLTSSFLEDTTNATSGRDEDGNVRLSVGGAWVCACNAGWQSSSNLTDAPCSIFTAVPRDTSQNVTGYDYGQSPWTLPPPPESSGSDIPVNTVAIGVAGGLAGLFLAAYAAAEYAKAPVVAAVPNAAIGTGGKALPRKGYGRIASVGLLMYWIGCVSAAPLTWSQVATWGTTSTTGLQCGTEERTAETMTSQISIDIPAGVRAYMFPGENWLGWPANCAGLYFSDLTIGFVQPDCPTCRCSGPQMCPLSEFVEYSPPRRSDRGEVVSMFDVWKSASSHMWIGRHVVSLDSATWSMKQVDFNYDDIYAVYGFAVNVCDMHRTCGVHGKCVDRYAFSQTTAGGGFKGCASESMDHSVWAQSYWTSGVCQAYSFTQQVMQRTKYAVRGCLCDQGWGGQHCEVQCPTTPEWWLLDRGVCTGHGYCLSRETTTRFSDAATCLCVPTPGQRNAGRQGCVCDKGWTGEWCEIAIQSSGSFNPADPTGPVLEDFSTCCPMDSPTCAPMRVDPSIVADAPFLAPLCTPTTACVNPANRDGCPCTTTVTGTLTSFVQNGYKDGTFFNFLLPHTQPYPTQQMPFPNAHLLTQRVPAGDPDNPYKCGEGDLTESAGWIPELAGGNEVRGHGKCWVGLGGDTGMLPTKSYCLCSNPNIYNTDTGALISQQRRGWFGPRCQFRTCTRRTAVTVPHTSGQWGMIRSVRYGVLSEPGRAAFLPVDAVRALVTSFVFTGHEFPDPAWGVAKQLEVRFTGGPASVYDGGQLVTLSPGAGQAGALTSVRYGVLADPSKTISIALSDALAARTLLVFDGWVFNTQFGDPAIFAAKQLEITFMGGPPSVYTHGETVSLLPTNVPTGLPVARHFVVGRPAAVTYGDLLVPSRVVAIDVNGAAFEELGQTFVFTQAAFSALYGDPAQGMSKQLRVTLQDGSVRVYSEGETVQLPDLVQCSGHAAGQVNGGRYNYDDDKSPCNDRPVDKRTPNTRGILTGPGISNVNSIGVCRACDHGWGMYGNINRFDLNGTVYNASDIGICSERTYHSGSGARCGGYGVPTMGPTFSIGTKTVQSVVGCDCNTAWGLVAYKDSGICQRTCAADEVLLQLPAGVRDRWGGYNGTVAANFTLLSQLSARCGGYRQGLCRPITFGAGMADGLNSACMCNAGYGGPACTNLTSMWNQDRLCGLRGEAVLPAVNASQYSSQGYADEAWFNQYVVPLNGANITDPANAKLYTAYQCRCTAAATADGWALDTHNICAPTCNATQLLGTGGVVCSGRGTCETDTRLGGIGKACRCDLGWGGLNCGQRILHDKLARACGGAERGVMAYVPASANFTQQCVCNAGYLPNPNVGDQNGVCWRDCPVSSTTGLKCTDPSHGSCSVDLVTGNDHICHCDTGAWAGPVCAQKLVGAYTAASGTQIVCTGHGLPHPDGIGACSCVPGWVGEACHVYADNRACDAGQSFFDAEAVGIVVG